MPSSKTLPVTPIRARVVLGYLALGFAAFFVNSIACQAATLEEQGYEIAARSDRSDRGFGDSKVNLKMILRNAAGAEATRTLEFRTLEIPDEDLGDNSLIIFDTPRDIDGTALLSHAKIL